MNYNCFKCRRVFVIANDAGNVCPSCGGTTGEIVSNTHLKEGMEAGVYWNIDPRTGGPAKKKKR